MYVQQHLRASRPVWSSTQKEITIRMSMRAVVNETAIEQFRQFKLEVLRQFAKGTNPHE